MNDKNPIQIILPLIYQEALNNQLKSSVIGSFKRSPEEEERLATWRAKHDKERKELLELLSTATGTVKKVVELHSVTKYDECEGCDFGGWEGDKASWPCRTIELIAEELKNDSST